VLQVYLDLISKRRKTENREWIKMVYFLPEDISGKCQPVSDTVVVRTDTCSIDSTSYASSTSCTQMLYLVAYRMSGDRSQY